MDGALLKTIEEWIKKYKLDGADRNTFIKKQIENEHQEQIAIAFDQLLDLTDNNPQQIIDLTRNQITNNQSLTFLIRSLLKGKKASKSITEETTLFEKIEFISVFWEASPLLKLPAYLFSKKHFNIQNKNEKKSILKYFQFLNLKAKDIDLLRKIRNANYHPFTFRSGFLINDQNETVATIKEVEELSEKVNMLINWWGSLLFYLLRYNPHFTMLIVYGIVDEIRTEKQSHLQYLMVMKALIPKKDDAKIEAKENQPLLAVWITKFWKTIKNPVVEIQSYFFSKIVKKMIDNNVPKLNKDEVFPFFREIQKRQSASHYLYPLIKMCRLG